MTVRTRLRLLILVGVLGFILIGVTSTARSVRRDAASEEARHLVASRSCDLSELTIAIGYGGLIHNFKNLVLRGDPAYQRAFDADVRLIEQVIARYEAARLSDDERAALSSITRMIDAYCRSNRIASDAWASGIPDPAELDDLVRVDDGEAVRALSVLAGRRDDLSAEVDAALAADLRELLLFEVLTLGVGTLLFLWLGRGVTRSIMHPVIRIGPNAELDAELASSLITESPAAIAILDEDLRVQAASRAWDSMFGLESGGSADQHVLTFIGSSRDLWLERMEAALDGRPSRSSRELVRIQGHEPQWLRWEMRPVATRGGASRRVLLMVENIGEYVSLRDEVDEVRDRLEMAIEGTNDGLWDWFDVRESAEWWSPRFYRLLGFEPGEIEASVDSFRERLHPDDVERTFAAVERCLAGTEDFDLEYRLRMKDESYRWFLVRAKTSRRSDGGTRMSGAIQDIHERRLMADRLEVKEHELRLILDSIPAYIYFKDDANRILNLNRQAAEAIGRPMSDLIGARSEEFFPVDDAAAFLRDDREVLHSGRPKIGIDEEHPGADGSIRIIRTDKFPLPNPDGVFDRLVAVATDVTEEREAARALRDVSERLALSLEGARHGAWSWDLTTDNVTFSDTWYTLIGYEPGELPASFETWEKLVHPEDLAPAKQAIETYLAGDVDRYDCQFRMWHKRGYYHWVRTTGRAYERGENGRPRRIAGMHIDIQEFKTLEAELEAKNAEMERFIYTASHDLKSPVLTILGYLSHLTRDLEKGRTEELELFASRIRSAAERMRSNIDALLEMSRIERLPAGGDVIDLATAADAMVQEHEAAMEAGKISVRVEAMDLSVAVSRVHLEQVLDNLLSNARKYGRSENGLPSTIRISATAINERMIELQVDDSGPGIPEAQAANVFGLFKQLDARAEGTGVGLAIVRRVADIYGGDAWVEPPGEGFGGRFRITLPRAVPSADAEGTPTEIAA